MGHLRAMCALYLRVETCHIHNVLEPGNKYNEFRPVNRTILPIDQVKLSEEANTSKSGV